MQLKPLAKRGAVACLGVLLSAAPALPTLQGDGIAPFPAPLVPLTEAAAANEPVPMAGQIIGRDGTSGVLEELPENIRPAVSADTTRFDEETGRYILSGNVRIIWDSRVLTTDEAQFSARTGEIWTQGRTVMQDGEPVFRGDALYASLTEHQAWFFGQRCGMSRPGLSVHSDTMLYNWEKKLAVFDGHVLLIQKDKQRAGDHLVYDIARNRVR